MTELLPTPIFLLRESPWTEEPGGLQSVGCPESDTTEQLSMHMYCVVAMILIIVGNKN